MVIILRLGLFVIPWLTIPFLKKRDLQKFLPTTMSVTVLLLILSLLSIPYKFWTVGGGLKNKVFNDLSFILGPFLVSSIWILKFSFGKIRLYMLINLIMDFLLAYPINALFEKLKVYKLVNFKSFYIFFISVVLAVIMYSFQLFITNGAKYMLR